MIAPVELFLKNGFHIPYISFLLYFLTNNLFLTTIITLKLFPANFFYWFSHKFNYVPHPDKKYNQIKQFIRFTDSGHVASFIYYFFPSFFPIAFNIHFIITFVYWYGKLALNIKDADEIEDPDYIVGFNNLWTTANHGLPLILFVRELYIKDSCYLYFTNNDLYYSYMWLYMWFCFVYLPWYTITNDPVYSILDKSEPLLLKLKFIFIIHILFFVSNKIGHFLSTNL